MADFNAKTTKHKIILTEGDLKGLAYPYSGLGYAGLGYAGLGLGYAGLGYGYGYGLGYPYHDYTLLPTKLATAAKDLREKLAAIPASPDVTTVVVRGLEG